MMSDEQYHFSVPFIEAASYFFCWKHGRWIFSSRSSCISNFSFLV